MEILSRSVCEVAAFWSCFNHYYILYYYLYYVSLEFDKVFHNIETFWLLSMHSSIRCADANLLTSVSSYFSDSGPNSQQHKLVDFFYLASGHKRGVLLSVKSILSSYGKFIRRCDDLHFSWHRSSCLNTFMLKSENVCHPKINLKWRGWAILLFLAWTLVSTRRGRRSSVFSFLEESELEKDGGTTKGSSLCICVCACAWLHDVCRFKFRRCWFSHHRLTPTAKRGLIKKFWHR